ncbi:MAG: nucleotidyltransferase family protein [Proteobacteria bacterium]|nr:nucleotidyltransferase family protein [Pseudomonadota bacterium]
MGSIIAQPPRQARATAVLVLAAGASRRLGRPKQLVCLDGVPLVRRALGTALALRPRWAGVVVGAYAARVAAAARGAGASIVPARRWREGLAASLAAGVRAAPGDARWLLVLLVDQWRVGPADCARLLVRAGRRPVAASYAGRLGVPALWPRSAWPALARLRGDRGAQALLQRTALPVPMPRAAADLDTPADLATLRAAPRRPPP